MYKHILWIISQYDPKLVRFYIDIYIHVSFRGHNFGTFYARKLKYGMLLTRPKS